MRPEARQLAQALYLAISETHPKDHDRVLDNFVEVLNEKNALGMVEDIEEEFLRCEKEARGIKTAEVTSARKLEPEEEKRLVEELNDYVGGDVELKKQVDEELLGGVVVRIGDEKIDGSVRGKLRELKKKLIR